ncbi:MAG: hypothetical protein VX278_07365 [Myxococcota bacterium]|nr:hypothetical protein [Myxococcota bacterium]
MSFPTGYEDGQVLVWDLPPSQIDDLRQTTRERSNYLVCQESLAIVAIPSSDSRNGIWAPKDLCPP